MIETALFYFLALIGIAGALGVVTAGSIIRAAVSLLFALISVAGLFALLDAEFLAAAQLIIFVGGVMVLLIFGVMLTARQHRTAYAVSRGQRILASGVSGLLAAVVIIAIAKTHFEEHAAAYDAYPVERFGRSLLGENLIGFELLSVLLLVVMIGAAYLAKSPGGKRGAR